jgi:hypothetical protein
MKKMMQAKIARLDEDRESQRLKINEADGNVKELEK